MKLRPVNPRIGRLAWCAALALLLFSPAISRGNLVTAETLIVDLDVGTLAQDDVTWFNGTGLGDFTLVGAPGAQLGLFGIDSNASDIAGVMFNGAVAYQGPVAPAGVSGAGSRTIEVWAYNPTVDGEETLVSWGRRGGAPNGSNLSFNYGSNGTFGAVGHWGAPDMGWNGTPTAGQWHHLVYTFDGAAARVYDNGVIKNLRNLPLNTHGLGFNNGVGDGAYTINVGAQNEAAVGTLTGGLRMNGAIAKVRVHEGVLSPADVINNYLEEAPFFMEVVPPAPVPPGPLPPRPPAPELLAQGPIHRYSFNGNANDSVGGADGTVVNPSGNPAYATFTVDGKLDMSGNNTGTNGNLTSNANFSLPTTLGAYVDLPNGIISALGAGGPGTAQATFEAWFTVQQNRTWARVFDFGRSDVGEDSSAGGGNSNYIFFAPAALSTVGGAGRVAHRANPGAGFTESLVDDGRVTPAGSEHHMAVVWDEIAGTQTLYIDGERVYARDANGPTGDFIPPTSSPILANGSLSALQDLNNWLGRAQWGDPLFDGMFNEFRIYDYALTPGQIYGNYSALGGPDTINVVPEPATIGLLAVGIAGAWWMRRRRG